MEKYKYIILDFGKVLAYPVTGHWFITDRFKEYIDVDKIGYENVDNAMKKFGDILSWEAITLDDEYNLFYNFYKSVCMELDYQIDDKRYKEIAYDFTYSNKKYKLYDGVVEELERLSKKYKLLLLSDNWPCGIRIMEYFGIDKYFDKMYISSVYECTKSEGTFFDYPIKEYNIKLGEALFIDDNEELLDVAISKGMDVMLMDRDNVMNSKYKIINNLLDI